MRWQGFRGGVCRKNLVAMSWLGRECWESFRSLCVRHNLARSRERIFFRPLKIDGLVDRSARPAVCPKILDAGFNQAWKGPWHLTIQETAIAFFTPATFSRWARPVLCWQLLFQHFWTQNKVMGPDGAQPRFGFVGSQCSASALLGIAVWILYHLASCRVSSHPRRAICSNIRSTVILWKEQRISSEAAWGWLLAFNLSKSLLDQLHTELVKSNDVMHVKMLWKCKELYRYYSCIYYYPSIYRPTPTFWG